MVYAILHERCYTKIELCPYGVGMVTLDVGLAMTTKDMLVKQGILHTDILN